MQTFNSHVDGYYDVSDQMIHDLRHRAERALVEQTEHKLQIRSVAAFEAHRERVRQHFLNAIGGLPSERTPLGLQQTGEIQRDGYRIEKLIYQSLPQFYVTALLYLPEHAPRPAPAVVFVHGHSDQGKAYPVYQAVCIDLVQNGFVVMAIDPPGQGERFQYWDPEEGKRLIGGCTTEHTHAGLQFVLNGASLARHFIWDVMRGVDYLATRPEVDSRRVGLTGNSGGGTQSSYLMLTEPRFAAAVPCTFPMTLDSYHKTGQPQDSEQVVHRCFVNGPDHDDYLTGLAPKPVLIGAAAYDFFPIEGTLEALERARRIYALYDAPERIDIEIAPTRHSYSSYLRQAAVNWFRRHLMGGSPDFVTDGPETLPEEQLWCTPNGQVLDAYPTSRTVFDLNREITPACCEERRPETLRARVRDVLAIPDGRDRPIYPRIIQEGERDGYRYEKIFFFSAPDIVVTGVFVHPKKEVRVTGTDLLLFKGGTSEIPEQRERLEAMLNDGRQLFLFDVRGIGGVESRRITGGRGVHAHEYRLASDAMMLGISTLGLRVFDVLRGYDYLRTRADVDPISIVGVEHAALWAYFAAVLEPNIGEVTCEEMLTSYRDLVNTRYYDRERYNLDIMAWGILREFDLPELEICLEGRPFHRVRSRRADGDLLGDAF